MSFKILIFFVAASMAYAGVIQTYDNHQHLYEHAQPAVLSYQQPAYIKQANIKQVVHEAPANYEFNYDVHDTHTGDIKQQHETAHDGSITGQYSLIDADGHRRIVDYTADDHHGFNAQVRREPLEGHKIVKAIQPVIAVQKVISQPSHQYYSAPSHPHHYTAPNHYHH